MGLFDNGASAFPGNVVTLVNLRLKALYGSDLLVVSRMLKVTDDSKSVGVFPSTWNPDEESFEIGPIAPEPTVQIYRIGIQCIAKDFAEENGVAVNSVMSKAVRDMLYRDTPLSVGLAALSVTSGSRTERVQRRGINKTEYLSNQIQGQFLYLSTVELWFETETK
jgi:hypothetical protein